MPDIMVSAPSPRGRGLQDATGKHTSARSHGFSAIAPGKGTASCGCCVSACWLSRVSAPSPRGRGLQVPGIRTHPIRFGVSAPSPRGRGLQASRDPVLLHLQSRFQRHRPGEGDCKRRRRDLAQDCCVVSAPSPRGRGLQAGRV